MKYSNLPEVIYGGRWAFNAQEHRHDEGPGGGSRPHATSRLRPSPNPNALRPSSQAERAVMQPNCDDVEWRYCRGSWIG